MNLRYLSLHLSCLIHQLKLFNKLMLILRRVDGSSPAMTRIQILMLCLAALLALTVTNECWSQSAPSLPQISEIGLRKFAIAKVMPEYPRNAALKQQCGVAVAQLDIAASGEVGRIEILEAPSPLISRAVINAVAKWQFGPMFSSGRPTGVSGKLTFYFVLSGGTVAVRNPNEVGYVGVWPKVQSHD